LFEGEKVVVPASWDFCKDLFDKKIELICDEVGAKQPPLLFFTNTKKINKHLNKKRKYDGQPPKEFVDNFRFEVAKEKEYKAGRASTKPFHFNNIFLYATSNYDTHVDETGLEADDAMCIQQYTGFKSGALDTIICSRDKDVRQCPGWHFSWECGKQASIGPIKVDELGWLEQKDKKIWGVGSKFFYYQLLVGDAVDNIGGVKGRGPVFGYNLLKNTTSIRQTYELVAEVYVKTWGDLWKKKFREQADLLWMVRELDDKGEKIRWKPPTIGTTN
jgi:hypothetical protein